MGIWKAGFLKLVAMPESHLFEILKNQSIVPLKQPNFWKCHSQNMPDFHKTRQNEVSWETMNYFIPFIRSELNAQFLLIRYIFLKYKSFLVR